MVKLKKAQASMRFFLVLGLIAILASIVIFALIARVHDEGSTSLTIFTQMISGWGR